MEHGLDLLPGLHLNDIDHVDALGGLAALGDLIALLPVDLAGVGEEEDVVMGGRGEHRHHLVLLPGGHPLLAHAALALGGVLADGGALNVPGLGEGKDALLLLDQVLDIYLVLHILDLCLALVAEFFGQGGQLLLEDLPHQGVVGEHPAEIGDLLLQVVVLLLQLLPVQALESLQAHIQNGLGLDLIQPEAAHEVFPGVVVALPDDLDNLVNVVLSDEQALQQMGPLQSLVQVELGAADDNFFLEGQVLVNNVPQGQDLRLALVVNQGQHIDGEGGLKLRLGKQAV